MTEKEMYTEPTVKVFEVRVGGVICTSGDFNPNSWNEGQNDWFPL